MGGTDSTHVPVTYERCGHIRRPFYHGTRSALDAGDELVPGHGSNFQAGRVSNHVYFTALVDTAAWGAEPATAVLKGMLDHLAQLREQGLDVIED